jgi:hypothetical protein
MLSKWKWTAAACCVDCDGDSDMHPDCRHREVSQERAVWLGLEFEIENVRKSEGKGLGIAMRVNGR